MSGLVVLRAEGGLLQNGVQGDVRPGGTKVTAVSADLISEQLLLFAEPKANNSNCSLGNELLLFACSRRPRWPLTGSIGILYI